MVSAYQLINHRSVKINHQINDYGNQTHTNLSAVSTGSYQLRFLKLGGSYIKKECHNLIVAFWVICHMNIIYFPSTSEVGLVEAGAVCGKQDTVDFGGKGDL